MSTIKNTSITNRDLVIFISFSTAFVFFLGFIDEGYYSFESFTKIENFLPFLLYLCVALVGQLLMACLLGLFLNPGAMRSWISAVAGAFLSVGIVIFLLLSFV